MVFENPWSEQTYLKANFLKVPDVVDMNRMERGDYYKKPTAYWFWNCEPTHGNSYQNDKEQKTIMKILATRVVLILLKILTKTLKEEILQLTPYILEKISLFMISLKVKKI